MHLPPPLATIVSMVIAGLSGAAIPLSMKAVGLAPDQSSGIILTTATNLSASSRVSAWRCSSRRVSEFWISGPSRSRSPAREQPSRRLYLLSPRAASNAKAPMTGRACPPDVPTPSTGTRLRNSQSKIRNSSHQIALKQHCQTKKSKESNHICDGGQDDA